MTAARLMLAPLQGFTEAPFRRFHSEIYGGADAGITYFSPFLRIEHGEPRQRDLRDIKTELNAGLHLVPQLICRNVGEFNSLVEEIRLAGFSEIDLNLGCPFAPQVRKGRGTGLLANPSALEEIAAAMIAMPDVGFSVKMRLGVKAPDEWRNVMPILNKVALSHITVHPRTATQQYAGELFMDSFAQLASEAAAPVIFNGDIHTPAMIDQILSLPSRPAGVMIGRGALIRPSLFAEWIEQREWSKDERIEKLLLLHDRIFEYFSHNLCGDTQILSKIKPYWEFFGLEFDRRQVKKIAKANNIPAYNAAILSL